MGWIFITLFVAMILVNVLKQKGILKDSRPSDGKTFPDEITTYDFMYGGRERDRFRRDLD